VTVVLAHQLSEEVFGNYRYLVVLASLFSMFSLNSISQSITQTAALNYLDYYKHAFKIGLASSLGTVLIACAVSIYYLYNGNELLGFSSLLIAILQPFISNFFNVFALLNGQQRYRESSQFQSLRVVIITIITAASALLTTNVFLLFVSYLTSQFITNFFGFLYFQPKKVSSQIPADLRKKYDTFALHLSLQNLLLNGAQRLDALIIFQLLGGAPLAAYTIAQIIPDQLRSMVKNFSTLLFPKYVNYTPSQLRSSIPKRSMQLFFVLLLVSFVYILCAPLIIELLLPKYQDSVLYTQIMALSIPASVLYVVQSAIKSEINSKMLYFVHLSNALIKIIIVVICVVLFGLWGAVLAYVISGYIETLINYFVYFYSMSITQ
jgi:O-antigen/teichoic acid export membrane protein